MDDLAIHLDNGHRERTERRPARMHSVTHRIFGEASRKSGRSVVVDAPSVATVTVRRPVTGGTAGAVYDAFPVHRLRLAATIVLGCVHAILIYLRRPCRPRVLVIATRRLPVATYGFTA